MNDATETTPSVRTMGRQVAELAAVLLLVELERLNREQDQLQIDWGRLQIEQSTWATNPRIESLARERLHLTNPADAQLVVVESQR
jgi:cell division protein FtsL